MQLTRAQLDLATLPPASLHKYLLFYNLIPPHPLNHEHAVRPLAPTFHPERPYKRQRLAADPSGTEYERELTPPATEQLRGPPPLGQEPDQADRRLVAVAVAHWNRANVVKEGETITSFMWKLRRKRPAPASASRDPVGAQQAMQ